MGNLTQLPTPSVIEELQYEDILTRMVSKIQERFPEYQPLESDMVMVITEAFAYEELLLRAQINQRVRSLLLAYSNGEDLDHICANAGVFRLSGSRPYARYEFTLSSALSSTVTLPKGLLLSSDDGVFKGYLNANLTIEAGELSGVGIVELDEMVRESETKTEQIHTPLPFVVSAKSLEIFSGGADAEDDESLKQRYLLFLGSSATAGSEQSYLFHTYSADTRIEDVKVANIDAGVVGVYLYSKTGVDELMIQRVETALDESKVRPLTDNVLVSAATIKSVDISARVELFDLSNSATIKVNIENNFNESFTIGEDLTLSRIIKSLHVGGVYKVVLNTPQADVICSHSEIVEIGNIELEFIEATL